MAVSVAMVTQLAFAGPVNPVVVQGGATITQQGTNFIITAPDGSIINYDAFSILNNESVRFIQPSDVARGPRFSIMSAILLR